ncbi:unnamed protein product [Phytophthora fragariaefolia]|uniref:Unnamed protein product n=1 Tax=Phytophthora fragariaefolia TaxID=1490495 RepID=A0A9W6U811_9STRA|nr:unnamed protein product [Phytophthora fragariaefolia]
MSEETRPIGSKTCQWTDPTTGESTRCPLQHAINFAYYVDGRVSPVPPNVGSSFNRTPMAIPPPSSSGIFGGSGQDVQELFDPFVDDDDLPHDNYSAKGA